MAPITWKNIAVPNFSGSSTAMAHGMAALNQAANSVGKIFQTLQKNQDQKKLDGIQQNTDNILGQISQIDDLSTFHKAKGELSGDNIRKHLGPRAVDLNQINSAMESKLKSLQNAAQSAAIKQGWAVGESENSAVAGAKAARNTLVDMGAEDSSLLMNFATEYLNQGSQVSKAVIADKGDKNDRQVYDLVDSLGDVRNMSATEFVAKGAEKFGDLWDQKKGLAIFENVQKEQNAQQYNNVSKAAQSIYQQTGSINAVYNAVKKADISGKQRLDLMAQFQKMEDNLTSAPEAQAQLTQANNHIDGYTSTKTAAYDRQLSGLAAQLKSHEFDAGLLSQVQKYNTGSVQGIIPEIITDTVESKKIFGATISGQAAATLRAESAGLITHLKSLGLSEEYATAAVIKGFRNLYGGTGKDSDKSPRVSMDDLRAEVASLVPKALEEEAEAIKINAQVQDIAWKRGEALQEGAALKNKYKSDWIQAKGMGAAAPSYVIQEYENLRKVMKEQSAPKDTTKPVRDLLKGKSGPELYKAIFDTDFAAALKQ